MKLDSVISESSFIFLNSEFVFLKSNSGKPKSDRNYFMFNFCLISALKAFLLTWKSIVLYLTKASEA